MLQTGTEIWKPSISDNPSALWQSVTRVILECEHESDPSRNSSCPHKTVPLKPVGLIIIFFEMMTSATLKPQCLSEAGAVTWNLHLTSGNLCDTQKKMGAETNNFQDSKRPQAVSDTACLSREAKENVMGSGNFHQMSHNPPGLLSKTRPTA